MARIKIIIMLTLSILLFSFTVSAENISATTDNGDAAISIEDFYKTHLPDNPDISRYTDKVQLTLMIKNNTDKIIKAWRAVLIVENPFGDILFRIQLTDGTANIRPKQIEEANFAWEDNIFIDDEPYNQLMSYDKRNLKLSLEDTKVIHLEKPSASNYKQPTIEPLRTSHRNLSDTQVQTTPYVYGS